ncbi:MAG: hypothetical protein CMG64_06905 [Candidatus Marinimicrobia bacterium]|nr:hypothetical protein [Candidatus Neomarinimicrobiota bacterium]|tara:strand:+ start:257 stop:1441 length:1185 start_codon:yes stop_codon:yes gene_type:complete
MNKKPLVLFYNFTAKMGGAEIVLLEFLKKSSKNLKYKVVLNEYGDFYNQLVKHQIDVDVISTNTNIFYSIKRESSISIQLLKSIPYSLMLLNSFLSYLRKNKADLIVSNTFKSHIIAGICATIVGNNVAWRFHDIIQREYTSHYFSWVNIFLMRIFSLKVLKIIGVSQAVVNSFKKFGFQKSKLSVVHNGLEIKKINSDYLINKNNNNIKIGWIGRFTPWKGIEQFINCAKMLIEQKEKIDKNFEFIIGGSALFEESDYELKIKKSIPEPIKKYFTFLGHIKDIDIFYNQIDIYFHTSIAPDPFPTTVLEAGHRGLIVFASNKGGAKEIIKENKTGFLIDISNLDAIVEKSIIVMNNLEINKKKGRSLYTMLINNFSSKNYCENLEYQFLKIMA